MTPHQKAICRRVHAVRRSIHWPRHAFSSAIGISFAALRGIEEELTPLKLPAAESICQSFNISLRWLASGDGEMRGYLRLGNTPEDRDKFGKNALFSDAYDYLAPRSFVSTLSVEGGTEAQDAIASGHDISGRQFNAFRDIAGLCNSWADSIHFTSNQASVKFYSACAQAISNLLDNEIAEGRAFNSLGNHSLQPKDNSSFCQSTLDISAAEKQLSAMSTEGNWDNVQSRLIRITSERGKQSALARHMGVTRQSVQQWIANGGAKPNAENLLRLVEWVRSEERKLSKARTLKRQDDDKENEGVEKGRRRNGGSKSGNP